MYPSWASNTPRLDPRLSTSRRVNLSELRLNGASARLLLRPLSIVRSCEAVRSSDFFYLFHPSIHPPSIYPFFHSPFGASYVGSGTFSSSRGEAGASLKASWFGEVLQRTCSIKAPGPCKVTQLITSLAFKPFPSNNDPLPFKSSCP